LSQKQFVNTTEFSRAMNRLSNASINEFVSREQFLNPREQYFYITPKNSLSNVPPKLTETMTDEKYSNIFPDLDKLVEKIYNSHKIDTSAMRQKTKNNDSITLDKTLPIDCSTATFISKCNLAVEPVTYKEFIQVVKPIRGSYKVTECVVEPFIVKFDQTKIDQKAGSVNDEQNIESIINQIKTIISQLPATELYELGNSYKNEYMKSGHIIHKIVCTSVKKQLDNLPIEAFIEGSLGQC
jgi:hypothetical protein